MSLVLYFAFFAALPNSLIVVVFWFQISRVPIAQSSKKNWKKKKIEISIYAGTLIKGL